MSLPGITHKRRLIQVLLVALALLLPFVSISGNPFLRMDVTAMTLFMAGIPLRIDQFYLLLLMILLFLVLFLLVTAVLGRVWCGWLCPQTVFNDLTELIGQKTGMRFPRPLARLFEHFTALIIATLVAFNLFCWFMSPGQAASDLLHFSDYPLMRATFLALIVFGYLNLILVKRSFCRSYCPYGRFQTALMDAGTLNLVFPEENRDCCLRCNACVRACPMEIDIRTGFQVECICCGRCIDACRAVMERRPGGFGLIAYRFGAARNTRFRMGATTIVLLAVALLLAAVFVRGVLNRNQSAFTLQRIATAEARRLPDGSVAVPWRAIIGNRSDARRFYAIKIAGETPGVELLGQVRDISVAANQTRDITLMIHVSKKTAPPGKILLQLVSSDGSVTSVAVSP